MLLQTKTENYVSIPTHTIVFIINAQGILKSQSMDSYASFKQATPVNAIFFL